MFAGCGGNPHRDLQVMSYTPEGSIEGAESIVIRFDKPVVEDALVSQAPDPSMIAVSPEFPWKGYWQDRSTLVIDPVERLAASTRYQVALRGQLAKRTNDFAFSFVHRPLAVEGVWGVDPEMLAPDGEVPLSFNQDVVPSEAARHCKLVAGADAIALVAPALTAASSNVALKPAKQLAAGAKYTLTCAGLTGAGGNAALDKPYSLALRVRPELSIVSITPAGTDIAADEVAIAIKLSTPVALDAIRKSIKSSPKIAVLSSGYLSGDGTEYRVTADLDTETDYKITINGLVDKFGQKLPKRVVHAFKTGDARPRISMERGIFALEASAKGYPVWLRNVGAYEVECAAIPKHKLVQVLTTDMNYDPWGGSSDAPIEWSALKIKPKTAKHKAPRKNKWRLDEVDLGATCAQQPAARGVFLAEIRSDEIEPDAYRGWLSPRRNRVLANVTDMGVLIKTGTSSGLVWVTSLATGAPVGDAKVTVYDPKGKQVFSGTTSADGIVKIPGSAVLEQQKPVDDENEEWEDWESYRSQRMIAIVEKGTDLAVVDGNWANGIQIWNFGMTEDRRGGAVKVRGFIQSDRGLYRPGETVHFKGIAREIAHGRAPRVPAKSKVEIEIQDSRGQTVLTKTTKLSAFGGFGFDLALGAEASLGDYYVRATVADQVFRERFTVEEFRPASFEVGVKSTNAQPRPGERLAFELDAKYLFGAPTADANVEWTLRKRDHVVRFKGYDAYTFSANPSSWWWYERDADYGTFIADGTGTTDSRGKLRIAARDTAKAFEGPIDYILSTSVTDSADQTMGKSVVVTAHKTSFYLGMHANELVQAVGMPFGVNLVALAPNGNRVATKAKLSFIRTVYDCEWEYVGARSFQRCDSSQAPALEREITIAATGSHTERIYPTEPGDYIVRVEAKDDRGNAVVAASQIWVIGKGEAFWSGDEGARMTLVASKQRYAPGETARLLPQANLVKPTALVTIERDGIIDASVMKLASPSEGITVPIADAWAPNVFASVALVSGRQGVGDKHRPMFKMGIVELTVTSEHKQLDVAVTLDRAEVRPGEKVTGRITVTQAGTPVKAEVSLSAADEGVLQLINYQTPNPMKTFYASYGLGVDAGTNWNRVARLADPENGDPDEGGDSGSSDNGQRVRSKFVASAYWAPMLVTDERGIIEFSFAAPDNLTAYRLMAVAADVSDRFGAGELRLVVNKPVMAAPALPRFLRANDTASVGVVVHNNTEQPGTAIVIATARGATLDRTSQHVDVPALGSARVRFATKASEHASVTYEFAVSMGNERDAVRVTLPIDRPRTIDHRMLVSQKVAAGQAWSGELAVAADVLRRESVLAIHVDRTGVGDLAPGLRSLVEYPYGCLEQTMSRFVPLVAAKDLANTLDDPSLKGTKAKQFIRAGIQKVIRHQQGDGMFSLWPQSQTYPHLAAYALWGLTVAEAAGEKVPADVFDKGIAAMTRWANGDGLKPNNDGATLAMAAYVMALRGKADASLNARLFAIRSGLPKWGQAFLLRAMKLAKADAAEIADLQKSLTSSINVVDGKALVREGMSGNEYAAYMNSDVRATAMTLAALLEVDPSSTLIDPLVAGLKASRDKTGTWLSTQDNLWSLVALAEYARRGSTGKTTVTIDVGGKQVSKRVIQGGEVITTKLPLDKVADGAISIRADNGAFVTARVTEARVDQGATVENGFTIERRYLDAKGAEQTSFKAGDMVTVKVRVTAKAHQKWVALVDPIPAGFEVVNPKLAAGGDGTAPAQPSYWQRVTWDHQELRDDRVLWFADDMRAGSYELAYQARATIAGTFTTAAPTVEAMYQPDVRARGPRATIVVKK